MLLSFVVGILANRWRLLFTTIIGSPKNVTLIIKAICVLHNFLRTEEDSTYHPIGYSDRVRDGRIIEGFWRSSANSDSLHSVGASVSHNYSLTANQVREYFTTYFIEAGAVSWQEEYVNAR